MDEVLERSSSPSQSSTQNGPPGSYSINAHRMTRYQDEQCKHARCREVCWGTSHPSSGSPNPQPTFSSLSFPLVKVAQSRPTLQPHGLYSPWNSLGQNTGVGSLSLLQEIFPTHGSNPGLPHYRWMLYQLSHKGSPRILEWVAFPFSSRSSPPRDRTGVSCSAGGFLTN